MENKDSGFDFEKLKVYQKALDFIDKIFEIYKNLPREYKYSLGDNLLRASLSIANNLAEGNGKKSKREKQRYFGTSLDSTRECISVFNVFERQKLITSDRFLEIRSDGREITGMIHNLISSLDQSVFCAPLSVIK
ncbi:MAG: four helix bundle protein [Candidatus Omnitrophica bacterium]|nr:four helix bundle protein [Candidatus Omnitrophota bacterium]